MKRFSPSDAALEGFRLTREYPGTVLAWGALYFLGILLIGGMMMAGLGEGFIAFAQNRGLETADASELAQQLGDTELASKWNNRATAGRCSWSW